MHTSLNILFVSDNIPSPLSGGIERFVNNLSKRLSQEKEISTYLAYIRAPPLDCSEHFKTKMQLTEENTETAIATFLQEHNINIIHVNLMNKNNIKHYLPILYNEGKHRGIKILFLYHNKPSFEINTMNVNVHFYRIFHCSHFFNNIKDFGIDILFKLKVLNITQKNFVNKYNRIYQHTDKIVLLSPSYISIFTKIVKNANPNIFCSIGNPLSFDSIITEEVISQKRKEVLIITRLDERQKRISLSLKIWSIIEKTKQYSDWKLIIVGHGQDEEYYKKMVSNLNLKNVFFEGKQSPEPYYTRASIFMMTSAYEGFPLTITESLQSGVVPIVFDSYDSVHDVVSNEYNGLIVPNYNINAFADKLMYLMQNKDRRVEMAENAVESAKKFHMDNIIPQWLDLFQKILSN